MFNVHLFNDTIEYTHKNIINLFYALICRPARYFAPWYGTSELGGLWYCSWRECPPGIGAVDHTIVVYGTPSIEYTLVGTLWCMNML